MTQDTTKKTTRIYSSEELLGNGVIREGRFGFVYRLVNGKLTLAEMMRVRECGVSCMQEVDFGAHMSTEERIVLNKIKTFLIEEAACEEPTHHVDSIDPTGHLVAQWPELEELIVHMQRVDPGVDHLLAPRKAYRDIRVRWKNGLVLEGRMRSGLAQQFIADAAKSEHVASFFLGPVVEP